MIKVSTMQRKKQNINNPVFIAIILAAALLLSACARDKNLIERVEDIPEYATAYDPDDDPTNKKLPEMTAGECELLGDSLLARGNLHMAFLQYERALEREPDNLRVEYKIGLTFLKGQKYEDAIAQFSYIVDKDPRYAQLTTDWARHVSNRRILRKPRSILRKPSSSIPDNGSLTTIWAISMIIAGKIKGPSMPTKPPWPSFRKRDLCTIISAFPIIYRNSTKRRSMHSAGPLL